MKVEPVLESLVTHMSTTQIRSPYRSTKIRQSDCSNSSYFLTCNRCDILNYWAGQLTCYHR